MLLLVFLLGVFFGVDGVCVFLFCFFFFGGGGGFFWLLLFFEAGGGGLMVLFFLGDLDMWGGVGRSKVSRAEAKKNTRFGLVSREIRDTQMEPIWVNGIEFPSTRKQNGTPLNAPKNATQ